MDPQDGVIRVFSHRLAKTEPPRSPGFGAGNLKNMVKIHKADCS